MAGPVGIGRRLPRLRGKSLAGESKDFPADLTAAVTLLMVAFRQSQQSEVDTWLPLCTELADRSADFAYYEIPLLQRRWTVARSVIDGGMRAGIPDPGVQATTVTVYGGRSNLLRGLGVHGIASIVVVAVDATGEILWLGRGSRTRPAGDTLLSIVGG